MILSRLAKNMKNHEKSSKIIEKSSKIIENHQKSSNNHRKIIQDHHQHRLSVCDSFLTNFGASLAPQSRSKSVEVAAQMKHCFYYPFWSLWRPPGSVFGTMLMVIWDAFVASKPGSKISEKPCKTIEKTMIFEVLGGRKSVENGSGNSMQQEVSSKSVLGGSWDRCWSHLRVMLGPKIGPEEGPKTS